MMGIRFVIALVVSLAATCAFSNDSRDIDLRTFHSSHRAFENYVRFIDNNTLMIGFDTVDTTSATPSHSRTLKRFLGKRYTVVTIEFDSGKLKNQHVFSTKGFRTLLPLSNGNFILADGESMTLYSSNFQRIATQAVSKYWHRLSLSSDEGLVFLREDSGNGSTIQAFQTADLRPRGHTEIPDLPVEGFGRVVVGTDVLLISRPRGGDPNSTTLSYRGWNSPEAVFPACASGSPLLVTRSHYLVVNCPPLTITNPTGQFIAANPQVGQAEKESISNWSIDNFVESRNGNRLATSAFRLGGGIAALDIGPHITHQRVIVLDSTNLSLIRSIPIRKHRSLDCPVALSPDGARLAYIHDSILTLSTD